FFFVAAVRACRQVLSLHRLWRLGLCGRVGVQIFCADAASAQRTATRKHGGEILDKSSSEPASGPGAQPACDKALDSGPCLWPALNHGLAEPTANEWQAEPLT